MWGLDTSNKDDLSIINNGIDTKFANWELRNTLAKDEGISARNVNVTLDKSIDGLSIDTTNSATCSLNNAEIAGDSYCEYKVTYGPTSVAKEKTQVTLNAAYSFYNDTSLKSNTKFNVAASPEPQPKIEVAINRVQNETDVDGLGTQDKPWSFTTYHNKIISLKYEFKNIGTLDAKRFNLDVGNLPNGAALKSTNCPNEISSESSLAAKASCTAQIDIPDPELFDKPNLISNELNSAILKLNLPFSYQYKNAIYTGQTDDKYIKFSRLWTNLTNEVSRSYITDSKYTFEVVSKISNLDKNVNYPITITPTLLNPIAGSNLSECTITDTNNSCVNKIELPSNILIPGKPLIVAFKASANGMQTKDVIISNTSISSNTLIIRNETELVAALKGDTSGKVFILEEDVELTKTWQPIEEFKNATFDGQGFKITGLKLQGERGMFKTVSNSTIQKLNLSGEVNSPDRENVGLLAGIVTGKVSIKNSNFKSTVTASNYVGGIVGAIKDGDSVIESVTVNSKVVGNNYVGGW